jgi:CO/xanthine dehydrogenase Mo-binding subunit
MFEPVGRFDWEDFDNGGTSQREAKVKEEHIRQAFELGIGPLPLKQVAERLQEIAGVGRSAAYEALKTGDGARYAKLLVRQPGTAMISLRPQEPGGPL